MLIIKLDATDSTNTYLKKLALSQILDDYTVVSTDLQFNGRGQMGAEWVSDRGKNLTISILKKLNDFHIQDQFNLNCMVSLAVYDVLHELGVPNLSVKWPNDILSGTNKLCGILVENILKGKFIQMAILGIGLNVNQIDFKAIEKVSSLKLLLGKNLELDILIKPIVKQLKYYFELPPLELRENYLKVLFRKDKPSTFKNAENVNFVGLIKGVDIAGKLIVQLEDSTIRKFALKEVKLLY